MLKELENKIKELQQLRENLKKSSEKLVKDNDYEYLKGYYHGQRAELLSQIQYLKSLVKMIKGE